MFKFYLWLTLCLQFALINAARTRRGSNSGNVLSGSDAEHVHIKVLIPAVSHTPARPPASAHHQRVPANIKKSPGLLPPAHRSHTKNKNKKVLPTVPTHHNSFSSSNNKELPYEFDFRGLGSGGNNEDDSNNLTPFAEVMHKYGPVLFTSGTSHQPISQQFMQQFFTPEMMSVLNSENEENVLIEEPHTDADELMQKYLEKFNQATQGINNNWSPKIIHKRKKYGNIGIGETYPKETLQQQIYDTILKQQQQHSKRTTVPVKAKRTTRQHQRQRQQKQRQQHTPSFHQNFKQDFDDDTSSLLSSSDEVETDDENVSSTSASVEDMTTAFNGLKPISYQDMYGEYATPITAATTSSATGNQQQQHQGFSWQQETIPSNSHTHATPYNVNNWLQQYQRPEKQKQQHQYYHHQQQIFYKPHHQQQQQQQQHNLGKKSHKIKSQQTQFVLEPTIQEQLRLATHQSPSSSSASSSPTSLSTSPISNGFGGSSSSSSLGSPTFSTSSLISSSPSWSIPYEFVHQSYQQQLAAQQQPQQQQPNDYELTSHKKHKNRTKRKRNRIIVE